MLLFLSLVVAVGAIGGILPGVVAAIAGFLLANWYFTPPIHTWTISEGENLLALVVFVVVSAVVSGLVDFAARRAIDARRARAEAETFGPPRRGRRHRRPAARDRRLVAQRLPARCRRARLHRAAAAGRSKRPTAIPIPRRVDAADAVEDIGDGAALALVGPQLDRRRPPRPQRVRRAARGTARARPPLVRSGHCDRPRSGERAARRTAAGGVARPADTARVDQGRGFEPAAARRHVEQGGRRRVPRARSRTKPIASTRSSATCST